MTREPLTERDRLAVGDDQGGHGEAALLLVESLIHGLVACKVISVGDAVEVVDIALDSHVEVEIDRQGSKSAVLGPAALLEQIGASLQHDLPDND